MRQSTLFTKTRKEAPSDEVSKNAQLLIRAGYIYKEMAGAYVYLPLGLKVVENIIEVIRKEMNALGGQEVTMTALQEPEVWKASGRWNDEVVDIWFKSNLKAGGEIGFGNTHEEPLTRLMTQYISSYKDLPKYVYQFQTKFRNETRAKSGIMRTREFVMKDLYSFSRTEAEFREFYEKCASAYLSIFQTLGLGDITYRTFASGGSFSKFSDEFQTVSDAGEDIIYIDEATGIALNEEVLTDEVLADLGIKRELLVQKKSIEVGNIFALGTKYSSLLNLSYKNEAGEAVPVIMGSYGIGPGRLMGTIVEELSDEKGIVWPESIAPFAVHLVSLNTDDGEIRDYADGIYESLKKRGVSVLYDDRDARGGEKFADSDLLGMPYRVVISKRAKEEGLYEVVRRKNGDIEKMDEEKLLGFFTPDEDD